jgi:hypothetical protein
MKWRLTWREWNGNRGEVTGTHEEMESALRWLWEFVTPVESCLEPHV